MWRSEKRLAEAYFHIIWCITRAACGICACCNYKRSSATPCMYTYVFPHTGGYIYRDFVYSSYRMCHR